MNLTEAITAVEQASANFQTATTKTQSDGDLAAAAQAKLDAINASVQDDKAAQNTAAAAFNLSLDGLIDAANAAKIPSAPSSAPKE